MSAASVIQLDDHRSDEPAVQKPPKRGQGYEFTTSRVKPDAIYHMAIPYYADPQLQCWALEHQIAALQTARANLHDDTLTPENLRLCVGVANYNGQHVAVGTPAVEPPRHLSRRDRQLRAMSDQRIARSREVDRPLDTKAGWLTGLRQRTETVLAQLADPEAGRLVRQEAVISMVIAWKAVRDAGRQARVSLVFDRNWSMPRQRRALERRLEAERRRQEQQIRLEPTG